MYQIFPSGARKMETIQKFLPIHINKYTLTLTCPLNFKSHPAKSLITNIENISGKITENRTDSRKPILKRQRGKKNTTCSLPCHFLRADSNVITCKLLLQSEQQTHINNPHASLILVCKKNQ